MHQNGLTTYLYESAQGDEIYCKVRASVERLKYHADVIDYRVLCDKHVLKDMACAGVRNEDDTDYKIKPIHIAHDETVSELGPYDYIYTDYDREANQEIFESCPGRNHPFSGNIRLKLLVSIFRDDGELCCGFNLESLIEDGSLIGHYPLHNRATREVLCQNWLPWSIPPWGQPIDAIKDYFGEKIGLYFEFLGHYTTWLLYLTIAGAIMCIEVVIEWGLYGNLVDPLGRAYGTPIFCAFVAIWSQLMLEYWKRTEKTKAMEWGMTEFEEEEQDRQGFEGTMQVSFIDGKMRKYFSPAERKRRSFFSYALISLMVFLVIGFVACIFVMKFYMVIESEDGTVNSLGSPLSSVANAVQIQVLNYFYSELAIWLTNRENHRTNTEYEDALIVKLFAFQFVNSYAPFFYIAFLKDIVGDPCEYDSCMAELSMSLGIIFGTRLLVGNMQEVGVPFVSSLIKRRQETSGTDEKLTRAEQEFTMEEYDPMHGTLDDYAELAIQYGYTTLFVAAFPLAPFLAFVSNIVEIRIDGSKLLYLHRRAIPSGAEDIGTWMLILQTMTIFSVITNAGVVAFTMELFENSDPVYRWVFFVCFQYFGFVLMGYFSFVVEDVPEEVSIQLQRQQFIIDKIIRQIPDEVDEKLDVDEAADMIINKCDDEPYPEGDFL